MAVIEELIRSEADGSLSFGNYELSEKSKKSGFEHNGDLYKVKTFHEITRLERNDLFVYESVPGTVVTELKATEDGITFNVEGKEDAQITLELEPGCEYDIQVSGNDEGKMKTNLGGKLSLSVELGDGKVIPVSVKKA
ncbi:MAG: endosialidase [Lachnospiraceae bacterium]|nr:endosialidase [Lachnospiraceae bacterium]